MTHRHDEWELEPLVLRPAPRHPVRPRRRAVTPLWVPVALMVAAGVAALWGGFLGLESGRQWWRMALGAAPGLAVIGLVVWFFSKECE